MNDTSISVFTNSEFGKLRIISIDSDPWFVAKDVCDALGISVRDTAKTLDEDERGVDTIHTLGGDQQMVTVSEAGLYALVLKSRKPEAKRFKRWVTHEVLPAIRKSGGYMVASDDDTPLELVSRALLIAKDAIDRKDARIAELEPKARFADAVAASDGTCLVGELAKMLRQEGVEIGQNRLFEWLRTGGYLGSSGSNRNVPTQRAMEQGLFRIKETVITHADGHTSISRTPKITGKGQTYFIRRFLSDEEYAQAY